MNDDLGHVIDLEERIRALFPVQLRGLARSRSEYNIPYITLANGFEKPEGSSVYESRISEAIDLTISHLEKMKHPGDVLVWREFPSIERRGPLTTLYMRLHMLPAKALHRKLDGETVERAS